MELSLKRPLLFFDIESTGLNIATDSIIELSFVKVFPDGREAVKTWRVFPFVYPWEEPAPATMLAGRQRRIDPKASEVNGIKDADLAGCPKFIEIVTEVVDWLKDSDLAGFNSTKFDLPILSEEIERVICYCESRIADPRIPDDKKKMAQEMLSGISGLDLHARQMVDVQNIYHYMEPRNLRAAYRFYCGGADFENAHTAEADTMATYKVLKGQLDMYREPDRYHEVVLKNDVEFLANVAGRPRTMDYAGRIVFGKNDEPTINFGKHRGKTVRQVYETEPSYFEWIRSGEFTFDTKRQFALLKERFDQEKKEALSRPLEGEELDQAMRQLKGKFEGGKLF